MGDCSFTADNLRLSFSGVSKLSKPQQDYYIFLANECFAGFSNAEDNLKSWNMTGTRA